jgi:hypothetical protein
MNQNPESQQTLKFPRELLSEQDLDQIVSRYEDILTSLRIFRQPNLVISLPEESVKKLKSSFNLQVNKLRFELDKFEKQMITTKNYQLLKEGMAKQSFLEKLKRRLMPKVAENVLVDAAADVLFLYNREQVFLALETLSDLFLSTEGTFNQEELAEIEPQIEILEDNFDKLQADVARYKE